MYDNVNAWLGSENVRLHPDNFWSGSDNVRCGCIWFVFGFGLVLDYTPNVVPLLTKWKHRSIELDLCSDMLGSVKVAPSPPHEKRKILFINVGL